MGLRAAQMAAAVHTVAGGKIIKQYAGSYAITMLLAVRGVTYALGAQRREQLTLPIQEKRDTQGGGNL